MNKSIRFISAAILLLGILLLAGNQIVAAGKLPWQNGIVVQSQNASAMLAPGNHKGTVLPPPVVVPPISGTGNYSVGGVCTVLVQQLESDITLHAILLPFNTLQGKPTKTTSYLAGVCDLRYQLSGKPLPSLTSTQGNVQICFAQVPNTTAQIYAFDGQVWTALTTTLVNGLECASASESGKYVLVTNP
ncbi:MAG TPA: hypothetical protein VIN60_00835 [Anaerolineales bacterium]